MKNLNHDINLNHNNSVLDDLLTDFKSQLNHPGPYLNTKINNTMHLIKFEYNDTDFGIYSGLISEEIIKWLKI